MSANPTVWVLASKGGINDPEPYRLQNDGTWAMKIRPYLPTCKAFNSEWEAFGAIAAFPKVPTGLTLEHYDNITGDLLHVINYAQFSRQLKALKRAFGDAMAFN